MHVEATARKPGCARTLLAFGISAVKVMIARYEKEQKVVCARPWVQSCRTVLAFGGVLSGAELPRRATELAQLQSYELISLVLTILLGVTTIIALVDKLLLQERLLEALGLLLVPSRREAAARHEAGHFLCAYLLAVPVQACILNPARSLFEQQLSGRVGTVFLSPAMSELRAGRAADPSDVDVASIVLMGGIAAEALINGSAEGGAADEKALAALLTAQESQSEHRIV